MGTLSSDSDVKQTVKKYDKFRRLSWINSWSQVHICWRRHSNRKSGRLHIFWNTQYYIPVPKWTGQSRWPRGLSHTSAATHLLGLRVRIPPGAWVSLSLSLSSECCVLSGRDPFDGPIPRPEKSYRVCVSLSVIKCNNNHLHLQWVGRKRPRLRKKDWSGLVVEAIIKYIPALYCNRETWEEYRRFVHNGIRT